MIVTNLKLKVWNRKRSYNKDYGLKYLNRRELTKREDEKSFSELLKKYSINLKNEIVLDLAAGIGADLKILSEFVPKLLIHHDKMEDVCNIARENLKNLSNVVFNTKDLMDLSGYENNSIKLIICRESLGYIGNDFLFFKEIKRILKKDGFFWAKGSSLKEWLEFYKEVPKKSIIKTVRHYLFDWPFYKLTGLRIFALTPVDPERLKQIILRLNFKIIYFNSGKFIEFLIKNY